MELFSERLRERAAELALSAAEVARRAGLSERRYSYYASGAREPDLTTLVRICEVLAVTPNELLLPGSSKPEESKRGRSMARLQAVANALNTDDLELAACQLECLLTFRNAR